ncbi:MAG: putative amino transferase [Ilumatobacteraceae bacterium]|nr:putative amino transferase [Ilumatobacteraceae bacterium]
MTSRHSAVYGSDVRALLIANADDCDAGFTGERFRHHGYSFIECHRERPAEWPSLDGVDQIVLLGSEWSVYWVEHAVQIAAELDVIRTASAQAIPIYGICFGSQSVAAALGGTVEPAREPEIGWYDDIVSDIPSVIPTGPWMQWHSDAVTVPPGATELARSPLATQAYRIGRTFATQFHPEVNEAMITRWSTEGAATLRARGIEPEQLRAETSRNVLESRANAEHLVDWYLEKVASG